MAEMKRVSVVALIPCLESEWMCGKRPASQKPCGNEQENDGSGWERGMVEESHPVLESPGNPPSTLVRIWSSQGEMPVAVPLGKRCLATALLVMLLLCSNSSSR